jgi:hypothetical protein
LPATPAEADVLSLPQGGIGSDDLGEALGFGRRTSRTWFRCLRLAPKTRAASRMCGRDGADPGRVSIPAFPAWT